MKAKELEDGLGLFIVVFLFFGILWLISCSGERSMPSSPDSEPTVTEILEIREGYGLDSLLVSINGVEHWEEIYGPIPPDGYVPTFPSLTYEEQKKKYEEEHLHSQEML